MMKWLAIAAALTSASTSIVASDFFEMRVRPVLAKNCFACHTKTRMGGLDMSTRAGLLQGGKSGPALKPGSPDESLLVLAMRHSNDRLKMPPTGGKLQDTEIADIATWIKDGAVWPADKPAAATTPAATQFWAYQPVREPKQKNIDAILKSATQPKVDKRTLLRRLTYDLTGLPPTPEEMDTFLADKSPDAYAKVVDRLLASPHYGEHWGRHWLDVARYSDDKLAPERDEPLPNAHYYRDWVIDAFNKDLPYDTFVKAHIAADQLEGNRKDLLPALGFYGLSPEFQDDRVDVTTRGFMAITVACAQCHDHKFDPIPTRDFYALQGVFNNTKLHEYPLAEKPVVEEYDSKKKELDAREQLLKDFIKNQSDALADIFANQAATYLTAARGSGGEGLDKDLLDKWKKYLEKTNKEHKYLTADTKPEDFQKLLLETNKEKKEIDEKNNITLGGSSKRGDLSQANLASLPRDKFFLWRDFFGNNGVLVFTGEKLEPYLAGQFKGHYDRLKQRIDEAKKALPKQYPFLHGIEDKPAADIHNMKIHVRGNPQNLGDEAPRAFLTLFGSKPFTKGSGRLELAESIASKQNPLTARVMVNRIWQGHFGEGIVKSPSNFGQLGERPSNGELLDYLAWRFVENGWSIKKLHREIVLSQHYQAAQQQRRRLGAEELRDSILNAAGTLDRTIGGEAIKLDEKNQRRTVYGFVSRRRLDPMLSLFDFPNPNQTSEQRILTDVPLQRLFLLNSPIVMQACENLAKRIEPEKDRVTAAYRLLFTRPPSAGEKKLAETFLANKGTWPEYLQVLFSSDEFLYVN
jgi:cytochrome c553